MSMSPARSIAPFENCRVAHAIFPKHTSWVAESSSRNQRACRIDTALRQRDHLFHSCEAVCRCLSSIGGEVQERSWSVLRRGGILIGIVSPVPAEKPTSLGVRGAFFIVEPNRTQLIELGHLIDKGILRVVVGALLPLARAREAFEQGTVWPHARKNCVASGCRRVRESIAPNPFQNMAGQIISESQTPILITRLGTRN